jgi:hypothetical protein
MLPACRRLGKMEITLTFGKTKIIKKDIHCSGLLPPDLNLQLSKTGSETSMVKKSHLCAEALWCAGTKGYVNRKASSIRGR